MIHLPKERARLHQREEPGKLSRVLDRGAIFSRLTFVDLYGNNRYCLTKAGLAPRRQDPKRFLYGCPEFFDWLENDLPNLERGRLNAPDPPDDNSTTGFIDGLSEEKLGMTGTLKI